jgi:hypothetical protein
MRRCRAAGIEWGRRDEEVASPGFCGRSAAALVAVASAGAEGKPSYGCSAGFDHHVTTLEATFLPRSAKAIEDGLISRPDLQAVYSARFDHNGNDMVCVKEVPGWEVDEHTAHKPGVEYFYNFVDDASSSSNGQ